MHLGVAGITLREGHTDAWLITGQRRTLTSSQRDWVDQDDLFTQVRTIHNWFLMCAYPNKQTAGRHISTLLIL